MNHRDEDEPLSRQAYREAQERANRRSRRPSGEQVSGDDLIHRSESEEGGFDDHSADQTATGEPVESREAEFAAAPLTAEEKTARLKHRLDVAIVILIFLIVIVYLILFFVG